MKYILLCALLATAALAGCAPSSPVGTLDVARIVQNWTTYQGYQAQLMMQEQTIAQSHESNAQKAAQAQNLQRVFAKYNAQLIADIQHATAKVAQEKGLKLVLTREGVGYGGVDITPDVEKALNITEQTTPAPSPT
ncbi:MAG: OmpH family outer membrane protein [Candidatus Tyrphobacter sp.]